MQIATIKNQTIRSHLRPQIKFKIRKPESMILKFLRKFIWLKSSHSHSIDHLPNHLKRDMGLIERDFNNKPRPNDQPVAQHKYGKIWL